MGLGYLQRHLLICCYLKPQMFFKDLRLYTVLVSRSFIKPAELKTKTHKWRKGQLQVQSRAQICVCCKGTGVQRVFTIQKSSSWENPAADRSATSEG